MRSHAPDEIVENKLKAEACAEVHQVIRLRGGQIQTGAGPVLCAGSMRPDLPGAGRADGACAPFMISRRLNEVQRHRAPGLARWRLTASGVQAAFGARTERHICRVEKGRKLDDP